MDLAISHVSSSLSPESDSRIGYSDVQEDTSSNLFFPLIAVIPESLDRPPVSHSGLEPYKAGHLLFIGMTNKGRTFDKPMPMPASNINLRLELMNNKDGWIVFVLFDGVVIIFDPFSGLRLAALPSVYTLLDQVDYVFLGVDPFEDAPVAFAFRHTDEDDDEDEDEDEDEDGDLIVATATPGDSMWSLIRLPYREYNFFQVKDIVFHKADGKFYAIDDMGHLLSFCVNRSHKTSVVCGISVLLANQREVYMWLHTHHLVSDGSNLFQVRMVSRSEGKFQIFKYCHDADEWIGMKKVDIGNNSIFIDLYGAKLLPCCTTLPPEEEGRMPIRRNCIYFISKEPIPHDYRIPKELTAHGKYQMEQARIAAEQGLGYVFTQVKRESLYVPHAKIYDLSTRTEEECCFTTDIQSTLFSEALMWFLPYSSSSSSPIDN